jgi:hypothetical protein
MQIGKPRATGQSTTPEQQEELLDCRMLMLGVYLNAAEIADNAAFKEMMRRCLRCGYREACAVDLERDPNNPVWETYCPNAGMLIELAQERWLTPLL